MSSEKPDVARGLRQMKTETDKVISASNEARWRTKLGVRIKEKYVEKKQGRNKRKQKKGCANVKRCKNLCEEKGEKGADM